MDLGFALVDGVCRSEGIAQLGVTTVRTHPNALIASSPFAAILIGTLVGGGGPLLIGAFSLEEANWTLRTPTWLTQPASLLAIDVWSSALLSALYAGLTSPLGFSSLILPEHRAWLKGAQGPAILYAPLEMASAALEIERRENTTFKPYRFGQEVEGAYLSIQEAHALCAIVLFTILAGQRLGLAVLSPFSRGPKKPESVKAKTLTTAAPSSKKKKSISTTVSNDPSLVIDEKNGFATTAGTKSKLAFNGTPQKKRK